MSSVKGRSVLRLAAFETGGDRLKSFMAHASIPAMPKSVRKLQTGYHFASE